MHPNWFTVQDVSIRLLRLVAVQNGLTIMTADVGNAFCTAPGAEKVYSRAGQEFGDKQGFIETLRKYSLKYKPVHKENIPCFYGGPTRA